MKKQLLCYLLSYYIMLCYVMSCYAMYCDIVLSLLRNNIYS